MLEGFLKILCSELSIDPCRTVETGKLFALSFSSDIEVELLDLNPGCSMRASLCPCPESKKEALFTYLMRANLLGQGTGGARCGLDLNEKNLTLSLGLPYEINYHSFKERFEEFVNHLIYWRKKINDFDHGQPV
jgi:hypothetical protein